MNSPSNQIIQGRRDWRSALSQYFKMLVKLGNKFVYIVKWSTYNFGFQMVVAWGNY